MDKMMKIKHLWTAKAYKLHILIIISILDPYVVTRIQELNFKYTHHSPSLLAAWHLQMLLAIVFTISGQIPIFLSSSETRLHLYLSKMLAAIYLGTSIIKEDLMGDFIMLGNSLSSHCILSCSWEFDSWMLVDFHLPSASLQDSGWIFYISSTSDYLSWVNQETNQWLGVSNMGIESACDQKHLTKLVYSRLMEEGQREPTNHMSDKFIKCNSTPSKASS